MQEIIVQCSRHYFWGGGKKMRCLCGARFKKKLAYTSASASTREAIKWGAYAEQDVVFLAYTSEIEHSPM